MPRDRAETRFRGIVGLDDGAPVRPCPITDMPVAIVGNPLTPITDVARNAHTAKDTTHI
jgi:hypothetical protein